jgi:hypothetical protein
MIRFAAELLKRVLSPAAFQRVSYCWLCIQVYTLRRIAAIFIERTSVVYGQPSDFTHRIRGVNTFAPTAMCRVMTKYGSENGRLYNYTTVYSALLKERYNQPMRIFVLGLGTNNADVPSDMGVFGAPGASFRRWRELFPHTVVYGADIARTILLARDGVACTECRYGEAHGIC